MKSSTLLVWGWVALVLVAGWRLRPRRGPDLPASRAYAAEAGARRRRMPLALRVTCRSVGGRLRRLVGRPGSDEGDELLGAVALSGVAFSWFSPILAAVPVVAGLVYPRLRERRAAERLRAEIGAELPDVVDLLLLAAGAGLNPLGALAAVGRHCTGPVGTALASAHRRVAVGVAPAEAFALVVDTIGEPARPLVSSLLRSLRDGAPLVESLGPVAADARRRRRRRAEECARQVPVRLLFPLVLCTLPAFALLTVVPLLVSALGSLHA